MSSLRGHASICEVPCATGGKLQYIVIDNDKSICLLCTGVGGPKVERSNARRLLALWNAAEDRKLTLEQLENNIIQITFANAEGCAKHISYVDSENIKLTEQLRKLEKENRLLMDRIAMGSARFGLAGEFSLENLYEIDLRHENLKKALAVLFRLHETETADVEPWEAAWTLAKTTIDAEEAYDRVEEQKYAIKKSMLHKDSSEQAGIQGKRADTSQSSKKTNWNEFRDSGFLWWINMILHTFGWSIVVELNASGEVSQVYPIKCSYRGFTEETNDKGYAKVAQHLKENIHHIIRDPIKEH